MLRMYSSHCNHIGYQQSEGRKLLKTQQTKNSQSVLRICQR